MDEHRALTCYSMGMFPAAPDTHRKSRNKLAQKLISIALWTGAARL
jgi:hypothetical protein